MKRFFEKYVTRRIHERLIVSGLKYGELWKYKEDSVEPTVPEPNLQQNERVNNEENNNSSLVVHDGNNR